MPTAIPAAQFQEPTSRRRSSPDALMYLTAAFLWVSIWRFQDLWPIIGKLQIPIVLETALGLTLLASLGGQRSLNLVKSRILALPFLLLAIMIAGVPLSLWAGNSVTFIIKDFSPSLLLMLAVAVSLRDAEDLNWLAFVHLIGAVIYAIWIYLFIPIGSDGRLGELIYYDANDFALMLVCSIPFAIYFLRPAVAVWKRAFAVFALTVFVELMLKSGSRGGFLGFIALTLYIVFAFKSIPARIRVSAVAIGFVMMTILGSSAYWSMMRTILHPKADYNMTEVTGRKFIWKRGVGYMLSRPVLGVGAANFEQAEGKLSAIAQQYAKENRGLKWSTAHNSFVLVGAELGVGGLVVFVTMIGTSFLHLAQVKRGPRGDPEVTDEDTAFAQMLMASLIGFCVAGFFVSAAYFSFLYALIGLILAEDSLRKRRAVRGERAGVAPTRISNQPRAPASRAPTPAHWVPAE